MGTPVGTGVAYVRFSSPNEAEKARKERHRQPMGTRYIECLPFTASHYTSPAALPAQMGPPPQLGGPFAMGMNLRYPGPPAAQRPFPSMTALGQALPGQEVLLALGLAHHLAAFHAQNQARCIVCHASCMQANVSSDRSAFSAGPGGRRKGPGQSGKASAVAGHAGGHGAPAAPCSSSRHAARLAADGQGPATAAGALSWSQHCSFAWTSCAATHGHNLKALP